MIKLIYNINKKNKILKENFKKKFLKILKFNFGHFVLKLMNFYGLNLEYTLNNLLVN